MHTATTKLRIRLGGWKQQIYEQILWRRAGKPVRAGRLYDSPPVIYYIFHGLAWRQHLRGFRRRFKEPGLLLVGYWWFQSREAVGKNRKFASAVAKELPGWTLIFLCNSKEELANYEGTGLSAQFINQNAFIDERIFQLESTTKRYDAIYDAQLISFKRHELASEISSLALISYKYAMNFDPTYGRLTQELLKNATWINDPLLPNHKMLSETEVAQHLNQARVGLCLSAEEGSMYASIQYLLCGIPIVSTPSKGGRDAFFNDIDSLIVEPNSSEVAAGVAEMISRKIDPTSIRNRALEAMQIHRDRLINLVEAFLADRGKSTAYRATFEATFVNKLVSLGPIDRF